MSRQARHVRRSGANPARTRSPRDTASRVQPNRSLAKAGAADSRPLLARILDTPHLAQVVPRLRPEVLHKVIERCGLEDCGELVTLATPEQLTTVLDLDLWRRDQPGRDEHLDADRFAVWLDVLVDTGADAAARVLASMDTGVVTVALAQHVRVFDVAAVARSNEVEEMSGDQGTSASRSDGAGLSCEVGGYLVEARRDDAWDPIVAVLAALDADYPDAFHALLRGCRRLSCSTPEVDGLDDLLTDSDQVMFDVSVQREHRRHAQGYATPAEARAFLQASRQLCVNQESAPPRDAVASAYLRGTEQIRATDPSDTVVASPVSVTPTAEAGQSGEAAATTEATETTAATESAAAVASLMDVLRVEGVLQPPPRALLRGSREGVRRLGLVQSRLQFLLENDADVYERRNRELAFLANALIAGCSIQARPFTVQEASDAALAVCNLGLENWPAHWLIPPVGSGSPWAEPAAPPEAFLAVQDVVSVFQVGWRVLYEQVCLYAAEQLIGVLARLTCADTEIQAGLDTLRIELVKRSRSGEPWRARDAMDVLTSLDMPAWATLLCLIDECPVIHAALVGSQTRGMRSVSASAFEFISENSQIASVRAFMQSLPATLAG